MAMGFGYDRPWRMRSWDSFAVPRPYTSARAVVSPAIELPGHLDRAGIEHYRQQVEAILNRLTLEAEAWAASGTRKVNEVEIRREPSPHRILRSDAAHSLPAPNCTSPDLFSKRPYKAA